MKKKVLLLGVLLFMFIIPNRAFAVTNDYAKLVWEGVVCNSSYYSEIMKVRITVDGVIGEQLPNGKVNVYEKILKKQYEDTPQYIIPVVDGGSIKVEYLGAAEGRTFQDSELSMGITHCRKIVPSYREPGYVVADEDEFIASSHFYTNKSFMHDANKETPVAYSDLNISSLSRDNLVALIFLPVSDYYFAETYLQIVDKTEAQNMLSEIKNGHKTYVAGKTLGESSIPSDIFEMEFLKVDKAELEEKYGVTIGVEDGFYPKEVLLNMLDKIYSRFPEGLIKEITSYYKSKGINTTISFTYKQTDLGGSFTDNGNGVVINYYPNSIADKFGEWVIAHEMGHYVHKYINSVYGYTKFKNEWTSLNNGFVYNNDYVNQWTDKHADYFVRNYSLKNYSEDFATVFEDIAGYPPEGFRNRVLKDGNFPLKQKVDLLNRVLVEKSQSVKSLVNIWDRALPQTPSTDGAAVCEKAKELGLIPGGEKAYEPELIYDDEKAGRFDGLYSSKIIREDFCMLIRELIEKETQMSFEDFVKSKGLNKEWYNYGSIGTGGVLRQRSNYPFCDVNDFTIFNLNSLGIINGVGGKIFNPDGFLTREQAAVILRNTASALGKDLNSNSFEFTDSKSIGSLEKQGVEFAFSKGLMNCTGDNYFLPKEYLTYEEAYIAIYNFFTNL